MTQPAASLPPRGLAAACEIDTTLHLLVPPPQGRAACEIDTADELLATELMFNGTFNSLDKHKLVALVSTLVPVDKSNVRL